jgi:hypothetical protein
LVIANAGFGTVRKKRQTEDINCQVSFDDERFWGRESVPKLSPIGAFVMTESFGFNPGTARIFYSLRVDD